MGATYKFEEATTIVERPPRVRIIRMRNVPAINSTGLNVLRKVHRDCSQQKVAFLISDIHTQPLYALGQSGLLCDVGEDNIFGYIDDGLNRARDILGLPKVAPPDSFVPTVEGERVHGSKPQIPAGA